MNKRKYEIDEDQHLLFFVILMLHSNTCHFSYFAILK